MNILITGARAPIAIEWAFRLKKNVENKIFLADSLFFPLGKYSKHVENYYKISKPKKKPKLFIEQITDIIIKEKIELVIPTCEEIFYLSKYKNILPKNTYFFFDDFNKLSLLHDKYKFIKYIEDIHSASPETYLMNSATEYKLWIKNHAEQNFIAKPVFSRFGSEVIFDLKKQSPNRYPVVIQKKLFGTEYCSYSMVSNGKIVAHSCYISKYKAGIGAGVYFEAQRHEPIFDFVKKVALKLNFTGQIAFDFIQTSGGDIYPIECNPRGTSGIYLLSQDSNLLEVIFNAKEIDISYLSKPYQIKFAMWLYLFNHLKKFKLNEIIDDYEKAADIYESTLNINLKYLQIISFIEIFFRSFKTKLNIRVASTYDIEWDGNEFT
jgi:predicted ATP-grasp superfamily ATP-dependent carboligase